jgi:hypothetical protein
LARSDLSINFPFRRIPVVDSVRLRTKSLFDPCAAGDAADIRVTDSGIFVNFTEEVLAINKLESPTPEILKAQSQSLKFNLLPVGHEPNDLGVV